MVYVPDCAPEPPPPPLLDPPPHEVIVKPRQTTNTIANAGARPTLCSRCRARHAARVSKNNVIVPTTSGVVRRFLLVGHMPNGSTDPDAAVVTDTVAVCEDFPFSASELGETEQLEPDGPPPHVNATVCAKPPAGATAIAYVAV